MKLQIAYLNKDDLSFPTIVRLKAKYPQVFLLPSDQEIENSIGKARELASESLTKLGIDQANQFFDNSLEARKGLFETVFPSDESDDYSESEKQSFEFVSTSDEQGIIFEDEQSQISDEKLYDARKLFPNLKGRLHLKSSTKKKNTFKVKHDGKVLFINKSTLV